MTRLLPTLYIVEYMQLSGRLDTHHSEPLSAKFLLSAVNLKAEAFVHL